MESKEWLKSFSKEEYRKHIQKIQEQLEKEGLDVMLLSAPENIFYATGYRSWYASSLFRPVFVFVPKEGEPAIYLRILERTTVENTSWCKNIYCSGSEERHLGNLNAKDPEEALRKFISTLEYPVKTIGIEEGDGLHYFWPLHILKELISKMSDCLEFVDGSRVIQKARMIKTEWEISKIEEACKVTEEAIVDTFATIRAGITTEKDIAKGIASRMTAKGVDRISYLTVNSGKDKYHTFNSYATDRVVQEGEIVLVDISGHIDGYASDLTRVMYVGIQPPQKYVEMANVAKECIHAGIKKLVPGTKLSEVSDAIEGYLKKARCQVLHTSGHSVGLTVTEYQNITGDSEEIVQPGMVFALENGVYPFDETIGASSIEISFRMEDEAVVTETGARWLSGPGKALYMMDDF